MEAADRPRNKGQRSTITPTHSNPTSCLSFVSISGDIWELGTVGGAGRRRALPLLSAVDLLGLHGSSSSSRRLPPLPLLPRAHPLAPLGSLGSARTGRVSFHLDVKSAGPRPLRSHLLFDSSSGHTHTHMRVRVCVFSSVAGSSAGIQDVLGLMALADGFDPVTVVA